MYVWPYDISVIMGDDVAKMVEPKHVLGKERRRSMLIPHLSLAPPFHPSVIKALNT